MIQLAFHLGHQGAELAASKADRVHGDWTAKALAAWHEYARAHETFTTEDVRLWCADTVPAAPDQRAWGSVARKASQKNGWCEIIDITRAKNPKVHGSYTALYKSLIFAGVVR
jgi:hypothetical protein